MMMMMKEWSPGRRHERRTKSSSRRRTLHTEPPWWFHGTNGQAAKLALRQEGDVRGRSPAAISFRGVVSETKDAFLARPAAWPDASAHGMFADGNEEQLPVCSDERVARYKMLFRRIKAAR
jgi:hypothetical protein